MLLRADVLRKLYSNRGDGALYNIDEEIESNPISSRYNEDKNFQRIIHELEYLGYIETNSKQLKSIKKCMPIPTPPIGMNEEEYHKMINFQYPRLEGRITIFGEKYYEEKVFNASDKSNPNKIIRGYTLKPFIILLLIILPDVSVIARLIVGILTISVVEISTIGNFVINLIVNRNKVIKSFSKAT